MITHSISSTKQSPLDCDWLVEFLQPRNRAETDQMVEESQTAHMFSTQTGKRLVCYSDIPVFLYYENVCFGNVNAKKIKLFATTTDIFLLDNVMFQIPISSDFY